MQTNDLQRKQDGKGSASGKVFAVVVFITYLIPAIAFPLILRLFPNAAPMTRYLLTVFLSSFWLLLGWWGLRSMSSSLAAVGLNSAKVGPAVWAALIVWGIAALLHAPQVITSGEGLGALFQTSLLNLLQQWFVVGLFEEILFRGYLLNWLRGRFTFARGWQNDLAALLVSNLIFASMHLPQRLYQVVQGQMELSFVLISLALVFLVGSALGLVYLRSGNLLLAGLAHGANNAPLVGPPNDLLPLLLFLVVVEAIRFIQRRRAKPAPAQAAAV